MTSELGAAGSAQAPDFAAPGAQHRPVLPPGAWVKYHALGNDYLVMDGTGRPPPTADAIQALCARHTGVGSDGLLWRTALRACVPAHAALRIFNPDGSEAEKSGNGLRIFARFLFDFACVGSSVFRIAVGREVVDCALLGADGQPATAGHVAGEAPAQVATVRTSMGMAQFVGAAIGMAPAALDTRRLRLEVLAEQLDVTCVDLGNPHCVVFHPAPSRALLLKLGPAIERHPAFARRTNVQLVRVRSRTALDVLIWERGAGETLASGSSSCAAAAAAHMRGLVDRDVTVHMAGGSVHVQLNDGAPLQLTGPAVPIARGQLWPGWAALQEPGS